MLLFSYFDVRQDHRNTFLITTYLEFWNLDWNLLNFLHFRVVFQVFEITFRAFEFTIDDFLTILYIEKVYENMQFITAKTEI